MPRIDPSLARRVAVVGTGLIGSRWASLFMAAGLDVVATDPAPEAEAGLRRDAERTRPALERLGLVASSPAGLRFTPDLEQAVATAEFVQENVPDDEQLKAKVIAAVDAAAPPETVIASSTSGILPTLLQRDCAHPERVLVGHPFNPVHILPLVEVVAGERTSSTAVDWAMAFYRRLGKRPLRVRREAPGFVANRMQEAIWREMFHLVSDGLATTAELDAAIADGPACAGRCSAPPSSTSSREDVAAWRTRSGSSTRRASPTGRTTTTPRSRRSWSSDSTSRPERRPPGATSRNGRRSATSSSYG